MAGVINARYRWTRRVAVFVGTATGGKEEPSAEMAVRRAPADGYPERGSFHGPNCLVLSYRE